MTGIKTYYSNSKMVSKQNGLNFYNVTEVNYNGQGRSDMTTTTKYIVVDSNNKVIERTSNRDYAYDTAMLWNYRHQDNLVDVKVEKTTTIIWNDIYRQDINTQIYAI